MKTGSKKELQAYLQELADCKKSRKDASVGLVPTMGALHDGHKALIKKSQELAKETIVSLFVNPLQFSQEEDFTIYPRNFTADFEFCQRLGVNFLFVPSIEDLYPVELEKQDSLTKVQPDRQLADCLCGKLRPRLFSGALTIVLKLLNLTKSDFVFFGEKDYQQLLLVQKMIADFELKSKLIGVKTVRDSSGLALSSRNSYLDFATREKALLLFETLQKSKKLAQERKIAFSEIKQLLEQENFEYFEARDNLTLELRQRPPFRIFIAARIAQVRLIDNILVE